MPDLTQLITRQSGLQFWYRLDSDFGGTIVDVSGNSRDMDAELPGIDKAAWTANQLNGYGAMVHNDEVSPFQYSGSLSLSDLFTVAKVDDTLDFDDPFRGFITGLTTTTDNALLIGVGSTTKWLNVAGGAANMGYLVDDVLLGESAREAPFDEFRRLRLSTSGTAVNLDGVQVGRDRADGARLFKGKWADIMGWNPQRTEDEAKAIALYYDLKFNLWRTNNTLLNFPTPGMTGINYRHFYTMPQNWGDTVISHEYEDNGRSFNEITDNVVQEWQLEFDCVSHTHALAKAQYEIFDEFWNAVRTSRAFNFTDKYGTTHTNVRIKEYSRSHDKHMSWRNQATFRLIQYP